MYDCGINMVLSPNVLSDHHQALLDAGFDPNFMLHHCVRRNYDDERRSALSYAVSNSDLASVRLLLAAGARTNQDPVSCLQVQQRALTHLLILATPAHMLATPLHNNETC